MSDKKIPYLPLRADELPFNGEQLQWLSGFMSGLHSRLLVDDSQVAVAAGTEASTRKSLHILFGSQTGNAEGVAYDMVELAKAQGYAPQVLDMYELGAADLANMPRLVVVTSTYGEGEQPDNAELLWEAISADDAPRLDNTYFSVLALGDTSYDDFCLAGVQWDERLEQLGATRVLDRVDCDVDYEDPAAQWAQSVLTAMQDKGIDDAAVPVAASAGKKPAKSAFNRKNPLLAELTRKHVLTGAASSKEIVHYEFSLAGSGESYEAGDVLHIIPRNPATYVAEFLAATQLDGEASLAEYDGRSLKTVLSEELEIRLPNTLQLKFIAQHAASPELNALLQEDQQEALMQFIYGKDWVDLLTAFPPQNPIPQAELLAQLKPLAPRAYSISSSINKHSDAVHLTIGSVRYKDGGRQHGGVCSIHLADEVQLGETVKCYFTGNKAFSVPDDNSTPIIMVGPGTGIAPFRAFLQEREYRVDRGEAAGENWLLFGDRNRESDYIYRDELEAMREKGTLNRLDLAFSRDQAEKIYVQDRLRENGADIYAWLQRGAYFYICGDAYRMAKDVDKALHEIIAAHGNLDAKDAEAYVNELKKAKRYVRDVY
ncbi:MAG: sulfite reductase subunit alpha [Gammaproteobacteria bacterium]|nr:MAG: sulfite reductase subunit alpha [Gammaproteobacteria bacterium]